jgi:hypothetical protein
MDQRKVTGLFGAKSEAILSAGSKTFNPGKGAAHCPHVAEPSAKTKAVLTNAPFSPM